MKKNRMISLLCAIAMSLTMVLPVGATYLSDEGQRSEYAGTTVKCQVMMGSFDTEDTTTQIIEVPIPNNATQAEQDMLVATAVASLQGKNTRATREIMDLLHTTSSLNIVSSASIEIGSVKIPKSDYIQYIIMFNGVSSINGASEVSVKISSSASSGKTHTMTQAIDRWDILVWMYDGDSRVFLPKDSTMTVKASTDVGGARINSCEFWASPYDLNG